MSHKRCFQLKIYFINFQKKIRKNGPIYSCKRLLLSQASYSLDITDSLISDHPYDLEFNQRDLRFFEMIDCGDDIVSKKDGELNS